MKFKGIIFIILLMVAYACGSKGYHDASFNRINEMCDSVPEQAIQALDSIDRSTLSEKERHRYDLLTIKSRDKAYIAHTSDSLILNVIDYYDKHRNEGLYAEALYYGGRVYSDIGDLPTALEFFQKSLDEIPEDEKNLRFRSTVLNQTGRTLLYLQLDSAGIEYFNKSLHIDYLTNEKPSKVAFTHALLATCLRRLNKYSLARKHINESVRFSNQLNEEDKNTILSEYAYMLYREGKTDSSLLVIRPLPPIVDSITTPYCLAVAAEIYKSAGILDTAYMYARQLTRLKTSENKNIGYSVIFSEELKKIVPKDTLIKLIPQYKKAVEDYLNLNEAEQAIIQNSHYNYSRYVKEKETAENELESFKEKVWVVGICILLSFLTILSIILWNRYRKSRKDSQLMQGYILAEKIKEEVGQSRLVDESCDSLERRLDVSLKAKQRILEDIENLKKDDPFGLVNTLFLESPLYMVLKEKAENRESLGKDATWTDIENLVKSVSPDFSLYLTILTQNQVSDAERKVAMLIKLGFSNTQIANLLNRQPATISRQRTSIAAKIGCDKSAVDSILVRL